MENYFVALNNINVNDKTEQKNGLTYLSWAWAWGELKKRHPDAYYTIYENRDGLLYHTDGKTCWVKTGVTINALEHIEYLPVMDYKNRSIPLESVTSVDVNKTVQRSLTKAVARHGLGLYIYAGEDLPDNGSEKPPKEQPSPNALNLTPNVYGDTKPIDNLRNAVIIRMKNNTEAIEKACMGTFGKPFIELTEDELEHALDIMNGKKK